MAATLLEPRTVSSKRTPDQEQPSDRVSLKLNRELMRKASTIAKVKGIDRQDWLEAVLAPIIDAEYKAFLRKESEATE